MTLEQLDQYQKLKTRKSYLQRKIKERRSAPIDCVVDVVEGSNNQFPYQRVNFSVSGFDPGQVRNKTMETTGWEREIVAIDNELQETERYIANIKDPIIKTSLELYYLNGATWPQASNEIYGSAAYKDTLRISAQRFIEKNP